MFSSFHRRQLRAATGMLETVLALFIGSLVLTAAVMLFSRAGEATKANELLEELSQVRMVTAKLYRNSITSIPRNSGATSYEGMVARSRLLPGKWLTSTGIQSPYKRAIKVYLNAWNGAETIAIFGLPREACIKIGTMSISSSTEVVDFRIGNLDVYSGDGLPLTQVEQACQEQNNYIAIDYRTL
ncbi:hypothetical protein ACTVH1_18390 [Gluconobacter cerinus]